MILCDCHYSFFSILLSPISLFSFSYVGYTLVWLLAWLLSCTAFHFHLQCMFFLWLPPQHFYLELLSLSPFLRLFLLWFSVHRFYLVHLFLHLIFVRFSSTPYILYILKGSQVCHDIFFWFHLSELWHYANFSDSRRFSYRYAGWG